MIESYGKAGLIPGQVFIAGVLAHLRNASDGYPIYYRCKMTNDQSELLLAVYELSVETASKFVKVEMIADHLGITAEDIKRTVKELADAGLVMAPFGGIQLTAAGESLVKGW